MSKNKNKQKEEAQELTPKLSTYIGYAIKKLEEIEPGHREIDLAVDSAKTATKKAVDAVMFIESIQADLAKAKKK